MSWTLSGYIGVMPAARGIIPVSFFFFKVAMLFSEKAILAAARLLLHVVGGEALGGFKPPTAF